MSDPGEPDGRLTPEQAARLGRMLAAYETLLDHVPIAGRRDGDPDIVDRCVQVIDTEYAASRAERETRSRDTP